MRKRIGGGMTTIQQQIEVAADPVLVRSTWSHFIQWAPTGPGHLVCDDLACVDTLRSGIADFVPTTTGRTRVVLRMDEADGALPPEELKRRLNHDLVVFKDYVERSGLVMRRATEVERAAFEIAADRKGDAPRHVRLSSEDDTTFWRSHFPT
jgi:hypothetical protein